MINFPRDDDGKWYGGEMWDDNEKGKRIGRWAHSQKWVKGWWDYNGKRGGGQKMTAVKMGAVVEKGWW